jgi:hypothetical protein
MTLRRLNRWNSFPVPGLVPGTVLWFFVRETPSLDETVSFTLRKSHETGKLNLKSLEIFPLAEGSRYFLRTNDFKNIFTAMESIPVP